ncbi:Kynureninase [Balamuthia mandrillaris]
MMDALSASTSTASTSTASPRPPHETLRQLSKELGKPMHSAELARALDARDPLSAFKQRFLHPRADPQDASSPPAIYFCGNSLGLQPTTTAAYVQQELDEWAKRGVEGHFINASTLGEVEEEEERNGLKGEEEEEKRRTARHHPWLTTDENVHGLSARLVGAKPLEVAVMNGLTVNLHLMMVAFYRPTATRHKILIEAKSFPSDWYAVESQLRFHGYDPASSLLQLAPKPGESFLRTEDILALIESQGDGIALVMLSGVQYYTGQLFEIEKITRAAHAKGCVVGFDLAHAVGNVRLQLHDWGVDWACWCSYKYLNSGPGGIAGCFVHERHAHNKELPRFAGWWGHSISTRFDMNQPFDPEPGAFGFRLSNPPVLACATLLASLKIFEEAGGMEPLVQKSQLLTAYLEMLLEEEPLLKDHVEILTPREVHQRGCQLSVRFHWQEEEEKDGKRKGDQVPVVTRVFDRLTKKGVICDVRKPDVMRIAPVPLYNSFEEVRSFVSLLREAVQECLSSGL